MDAVDFLQMIKEQLHELGIFDEALECLTTTMTIEELVDFLNDCQLETTLYINIY